MTLDAVLVPPAFREAVSDKAWVDATHDHLDVQDGECDGNDVYGQGYWWNPTISSNTRRYGLGLPATSLNDGCYSQGHSDRS